MKHTLLPDENFNTGLGTTLGFDVDTLTTAPGGLFTTTFCWLEEPLDEVTVFMVGAGGMVGLDATFLNAGRRR